MYLNFSLGTSHLLIARWWRIFVSWGGGGVVGSAVETEERSVVTNRQSYINWKIRTNYLQPMIEDRKNSTESNGGGGGGGDRVNFIVTQEISNDRS